MPKIFHFQEDKQYAKVAQKEGTTSIRQSKKRRIPFPVSASRKALFSHIGWVPCKHEVIQLHLALEHEKN
jgi:hypothetical protein